MAASPESLSPMHKEMLRIFKVTTIEGVEDVGCDDEDAVEGEDVTSAVADGTADTRAGAVGNLIAMIKSKLADFFEIMRDVADLVGEGVRRRLVHMVPDFVMKILKHLVPSTAVLTDGLKEAAKAITRSVTYYRTQHLGQQAVSQVATDVINRIRTEIAAAAKKNAVISILSTGLVCIDLATAGISSTATGIARAAIAIFNFLSGQYQKIVMKARYLKFQAACSEMYDDAANIDDAYFHNWFTRQMAEIPILASYILNIPIFSSPFNFLNLADVVPPKPTVAQKVGGLVTRLQGRSPAHDRKTAYQQQIIEDYRKLQAEAKSFIAESPIQLESNEPGAKQYMRAARGQPNYLPGHEPEEKPRRAARLVSTIVVQGAGMAPGSAVGLCS